MFQQSKVQGFTLLELMATTAVLAIVAGIAAPSFVSLIEGNRVQTQANAFFTSLIAPRSEAVKRNQPVVLCKSADGVACGTGGRMNQAVLGAQPNLNGQAECLSYAERSPTQNSSAWI